jgi:membrane protease YdiL (CAAX protease family)
VARSPGITLKRLGLVKPTGKQVLLGIGILAGSLLYDYLWSLLTHQLPGNLAGKLTHYNTGAFGVGGGGAHGAGGGAALQGSLILALATGLCAGLGEETLMRGAVQPALGIVPAGVIHGLAHGQFSQAPLFIVQVALWSILMGVVRRYTNTTTTMIGHVLYNFVLTFLFAFNP